MKNNRFSAVSHILHHITSHHRYTSLGERGDTAKNEALRLPDGRYRPAYELAEQEEHLERSPRTPVASPRSPPGNRDSGGDGSGGGGSGGRGDRNKRFSSWDKEWEALDALDADSSDEGTPAAATCAAGDAGATAGGGGGGGRGGVISIDARSPEGGKVLMGITSNTAVVGGVACRPPDGSKAPGGGGGGGGSGGGGGGLTGWVGSWLPLTTIAVALVLAALGVRSSPDSSSSRGGEYDGAPEKGD